MPRNTLGDLNNHLFAQLERLSDEDLQGEQLREEIIRAKAVASIAKEIVESVAPSSIPNKACVCKSINIHYESFSQCFILQLLPIITINFSDYSPTTKFSKEHLLGLILNHLS